MGNIYKITPHTILMKVRPTGILIEDGKLLLLKQDLGFESSREYCLPGGTLEEGESLHDCLVREMEEETGLEVEIGKLLYVCDRITPSVHVLHITYLVRKVGGELMTDGTDRDSRKIEKAFYVPISSLVDYGFSEKFMKLVQDDFPGAGNYMGEVNNIGL